MISVQKQNNQMKIKRYKLFLDMNYSFIQQRFQAIFQEEIKSSTTLLNINQTKIQSFVNQVMNFGKNAQLNFFYSQLNQNILIFMQSNKKFSIETVLQLLNYCIQNGFENDAVIPIFDQNYQDEHNKSLMNQGGQHKNIKLTNIIKEIDQKNIENKKVDRKQNKKKQVQKKTQIQAKQKIPVIKQKKIVPMMNISIQPQKKKINQILKQNVQQYEQLLKLQTLKKQEKVAIQQSLTALKIQFLTLKGELKKKKQLQANIQSPNNKNIQQQLEITIKNPTISPQQILKKKLKKIFYYYCSQQQILPNNTTFDYIKNQSQTMNLGKFIMFCKSNNILNGKLERLTLIEKFKKISQGNQQIGFEKFFQLLESLKSIQNNKNFYDAILAIENSSKFEKKLKSVAFPFNIRDKQQFRGVAQMKGSLEKKQLTNHSGQLASSLQEELQYRKNQRSLKMRSSERYTIEIDNINSGKKQNKNMDMSISTQINRSVKNESVFSIDNLNNFNAQKNLKKLSKFITNDEDDDDWLKQYKIDKLKSNRQKNIIDNMYKRVKQISVLEKNSNLEGVSNINLTKQKRLSNMKAK